MAMRMMAAPMVETQSTMGRGEGERMGVVKALSESEGRRYGRYADRPVVCHGESDKKMKSFWRKAEERRGRRQGEQGGVV
jgi:hypothetical protein